jgi:hypothetical protein
MERINFESGTSEKQCIDGNEDDDDSVEASVI